MDGHRSLPAWVRAAADTARGRPPVTVRHANPAELRPLTRQLAALGNNINQLARQANRNPATATQQRTLAVLEAYRAELRELAERCM